MTASIGIAGLDPGADAAGGDTDSDALLRRANMAMYAVQSRGGNGFERYDPERHRLSTDRLQLEHSLGQALRTDEFAVHYQPQVEVTTGRIAGVEALVRWQHPGFGTVSPDRFIDLAEKTGAIVLLGEWVLREACRQVRAWDELGLGRVRLSVNASVHQLLRTDDFPKVVASILAETGMPAEDLTLELTESSVIDELEAVSELLRRLRALGIRIAIDDFGRGSSCLHALAHLPKDELKLDQSFLHRAVNDPDSAAITGAILDIGKRLDLTLTAEGVERADQLEFLRTRGCPRAQGFYFARPLPADQVAELLRAGTLPVPAPASAEG